MVDDLDVLWSTKALEQECRQPQTTKFYTKECIKKHKQNVGLVKEHISLKDACPQLLANYNTQLNP